MLRTIKLHYSGTLHLPDVTLDPFAPWQCTARHHTRGHQAYLGRYAPAIYHPTPASAVQEAVELSPCGPVSNLTVTEA